MGNSVARKGDPVFNPKDWHADVKAPVPVTGNITEGSQNSFCNDFPIARKGDKGVHAACTGSNDFTIHNGSPVLFTNDKATARAKDETKHCGSNPPGGNGNILNLTSMNTFA